MFLFQDNSLKNEVLNTYVVGASIENKTIEDLKKPVSIVLQHRNPHGVEYHIVAKGTCVIFTTLRCIT